MKFLMPIDLMTATADPASGAAGDLYYNTTDQCIRVHNGTAWEYADQFVLPYTFQGTLAVTTGVLRLYNNSGSQWTIFRSDVYVATAPTGAAATFLVKKNGTTAQTLTVATGTNAANSTTKVTVANGDYLTVDISTVGSTVAGANAQLVLNVAG